MRPPKLKRSMGLWMATALVVGNMIGSGVFLLPASLADTAGPVSMLGWVFTGAGAILLALVFASLGRALPRTGGPYAYAKRAFGDFIGFWTAWGYWIAAWAGNAAIAVAFVGYLAVFWPEVGTENLLGALVGIGVIWLVTAINILGVRETGRVQVVTTVLKFVPLAVIGIVGLFFIDGGNYEPFSPARHEHRAAVLDRGADAVGLHRPRVRDRPGRGGQGSGAHDPARDDPRHDPRDARLHRRDRRDHGHHPDGRARRVHEPLRGRRRPGLRRRLGQGHRAGRAGLHVRRAQRLDPDPGPRAAGGRRGRHVPGAVRPRARHAQDAGVRARRLVDPRERR